MPVSSPSYFPPNRSNGSIVGITAGMGLTGARDFVGGKGAGNYLTVSDIIVIGDSALSAGTLAAPITDANAQYSVILGSQSGKAATTFTAIGTGPAVIIGGNSLPASADIANMIVVGCQNFPLISAAGGFEPASTIAIGNGIGASIPSGSYNTRNDILIGHGILPVLDDTVYGGSQQNIIIGHQACSTTTSPSPASFDFNVVIGNSAATPLKSNKNVIVGYACCNAYTGPNGNGFGVVAVGQGISLANNNRNTVIVGCQGSAIGGDRNVFIGTNVQAAAGAGSDNTLIGDATARTPNWGAMSGARCTFLGSNAGYEETLTNSDRFIAETYDGATLRALLYGIMGTGNLLIGNSTPAGQAGANRDFGGTGATNVLKLINGTPGNADPVGGGYFYATAGALHWVGSSGTDTTLANA